MHIDRAKTIFPKTKPIILSLSVNNNIYNIIKCIIKEINAFLTGLFIRLVPCRIAFVTV